MNILLVKLSAIGDVIHTLPSLGALRRLYPQAHITWVVEEAAADLVTNHPWLDEVIVFHRKTWLKSLRAGTIFPVAGEIRAFVKRLQARNYDLVLDFHGLFKSSLLVWLSRGKRKVGFDSYQELSGFFLHEKVFEDYGKHAVDRYLDIVRYLGAKQPETEFLLPWAKENEHRVARLLEEGGIEPTERFVALNPVALWPTKQWPVVKFAHLCELIVRELGVKVVLTGLTDMTMQRLAALVKVPVVNLSGRTSLKDLACLYRRAALLVTPDSGPMHLAAAVGTKVIALFGPTDPARTGPFGPGHRVLYRNIACRPCFKKKCADPLCLSELSVEEVFREVKDYFRVAPRSSHTTK